ncbi:MAG: diphthine--ammonia ligase [Nanoarchaeota archaeon]
MEVAILYSGGKDSTLAIEHCVNKDWNIKYLISVKPNRTDCFLFHFATVEHTKDIAKILGLNHIYVTCDVSDPKKEANIIKDVVLKNPVDAVILGGTGLQETQIKSIRDALFDLGIEVFATHTGEDHGKMLYDLIRRGYDIRITQVAVEGLGEEWLGKKMDLDNFEKLKKLSEKFGFHIGAEGGHYDTLVVDAPFFNKRLELLETEKIMEDKYCGYLKVNKVAIVEKRPIVRIR